MKAQIALEFVIMFALVVVVFLFFFGLIVSQRAAVLNQQGFSQLQLIAQDIAQQIDLAASSGTGYFSNTSLYSNIGLPISNISVNGRGLVIVTSQLGTQNSIAVAYSNVRSVLAPGALSANFISVQNYLGSICVDSPCRNLTNQASAVQLSSIPSTQNGINGHLLQAKAVGTNGVAIANVLVGFQATLGNFTGSNGMRWFTNYTNANGIASAFIYQAGPSGLSRVTATAFYQANGMADNLTGWWPMNLGAGANAYDISGSNDIGTMTNASYALPAFSAKFNPDSYMVTNTEASSASTITLSAWVYPTSYTANQAIIGQGNSGTDSWELFQNGTKYTFRIYGVGTVSFGSVYVNRWSHVAVTYSSGTTNAFINGAPSGNFILGSTLLANRPLYIGYSNNDITSSYFSGMVSNLQVYNTVLSQNSISDLYALGVSSPPVNAAILGWWPLNGNTRDYGGNANNAVPFGSMSFTNPNLSASINANASSGYVAAFNGINSYVKANGVSPASFSISAWVYLNSYKDGIIESGNTVNTNHLLMLENTNTNCGNSVSNTNYMFKGKVGWSSGYETVCDPVTPVLGTWYYVATTYNGNVLGIYVDGALMATNSISESAGSSNAEYIGAYSGGSGSYSFNGLISNVQIYNDSLNAAQVLQLYYEGQQSLPLQNGHLVGWWPLEGNANDSASNALPSTSTNVIYNQYQFPSPGATQYSLSGYGTEFNGAGNILIPNNVVVGSNTLSLLASVYPSQYITGNVGILSFNGIGSGFYLNATKGAYGTANAVFGVDIGGSWKAAVAANAFPNPGTWYTVAGVYNGSSVNIYVGGQLYSSTPASGSITLPDNTILFGGTAGHSFNGTIANVQVYKSAFSANQINLLNGLGMPASASLNVPISTT